MSEVHSVRQTNRDDFEALVDILSEAFSGDPVFNWFVRGGRKRLDALRRIFEITSPSYIKRGASLIAENRQGAALWMPPRSPGNPPSRSPAQRIRSAMLWTSISGLSKRKRLRYLDELVTRKHPEKPHYYLFALGVRNELQGRGLGSAMLAKGLERCDEEGIPAYLENSNERNLPLYTRHGFDITERLDLPWEGPSMWLMWRRPQTK